MDKRQWYLGRLVSPQEVFNAGAVGIEGERIFYAGEAADAPRDPRDPVRQVDGWITPGLIDLHLHGAGGCDLMEATPQAVCAVGRTLAQHGTTAYLATSVCKRELASNRHLEVTAELVGSSDDGAEILGIHLEGPFVHPARGGLIRSDRIWPPDRNNLAEIVALSRGKLKMMTLAPELPGGLALIPQLADCGAVASLGHTDASFDEARTGFEAGIRHVTHLYNAMRGLHHREPGALGAVLMGEGATAQIIADGVHVHRELLAWTAQVLSPDSLVLITDALPSAGLADGTYQYDGRVYHAEGGSAWYRTPGEADRLFGTTLLMDALIPRAMKLMEVSFQQAIAMATLHPARTLGLEKHLGTLTPGCQADLVFWDEQFRVRETIIRGRSVWSTPSGVRPF